MQRLITSNVRKCRCIGEFFRIQLVKTTSIALERTYSVAMLLRQGARRTFSVNHRQESCEVDERVQGKIKSVLSHSKAKGISNGFVNTYLTVVFVLIVVVIQVFKARLNAFRDRRALGGIAKLYLIALFLTINTKKNVFS